MATTHLLLVIVSLIYLFQIEKTYGGSIPCPPLPSGVNVIIYCTLPPGNKRIPCTGPISGVPRKTVAKYKCQQEETFSESALQCKCRGKWKGYDEFINHTSTCTFLQKPFSLDGPRELNLSESNIKSLTENSNIGISDSTPQYSYDALAYHNFYRKLHGAAPLRLNGTLSKFAQNWATEEVNKGEFKMEPPSPNKTYISNMYQLSLRNGSNFDPSKAVKLAVARWYANGNDYDYEVPVANAFSAMIWNSTTDLGVAVASNDGKVLVVCNYWPPGNVYLVGGKNGEGSLALFRKNVFPLLTNSTSSVN